VVNWSTPELQIRICIFVTLESVENSSALTPMIFVDVSGALTEELWHYLLYWPSCVLLENTGGLVICSIYTTKIDGGKTFAKNIMLRAQNKGHVVDQDLPIGASGSNVYVAWWTNKTGVLMPVFRGSYDNGNTYIGKHDIVTIVEASSEEAMISVLLATGKLGTVRSETLKAFPISEAVKVIEKLP